MIVQHGHGNFLIGNDFSIKGLQTDQYQDFFFLWHCGGTGSGRCLGRWRSSQGLRNFIAFVRALKLIPITPKLNICVVFDPKELRVLSTNAGYFKKGIALRLASRISTIQGGIGNLIMRQETLGRLLIGHDGSIKGLQTYQDQQSIGKGQGYRHIGRRRYGGDGATSHLIGGLCWCGWCCCFGTRLQFHGNLIGIIGHLKTTVISPKFRCAVVGDGKKLGILDAQSR
mmetsp:Transcript_7602/g.15878  ORF Transcript_7602/g.15878 Transcript_7602/m.15878 type:complete len:227 (+) Transcript_7602:1434-2114(+)